MSNREKITYSTPQMELTEMMSVKPIAEPYVTSGGRSAPPLKSTVRSPFSAGQSSARHSRRPPP